MKEDVVVEKLLEIIERLQKRCDDQQQEIQRLTEQLEIALINQPVRYVPTPGYREEPITYPCGPGDYPPGPIFTCEPDPDHLPYGYNPKDPLNSRSVSL